MKNTKNTNKGKAKNIKKTDEQVKALEISAEAHTAKLSAENINVVNGKSKYIKAKAGKHYVLDLTNNKDIDGNFIVKKVGLDLEVLFEDNTSIAINNYFGVCAKDFSCVASIKYKGSSFTADNTYYVVDGNFVNVADGSQIAYIHGGEKEVFAIANGQSAIFSSSFSDLYTAGALALTTSFDAALVAIGVAGAAASAGSSGAAEIAGTIINGIIALGPVIKGHGLVATIYDADGNILKSNIAIDADGKFSVNLGDYKGLILVKVIDTNAAADYKDEGNNGQEVDLTTTLSSLADVSSGGAITVVITPLTTIAARVAGVGSNGEMSEKVITIVDAKAANDKVATGFNLAGVDLSKDTPTLVIIKTANNDISYQPGDAYGQTLAAMSGVDKQNSGDVEKTIIDFTTKIIADDATLLTDLQAGAQVAVATIGRPNEVTLPKVISTNNAPSDIILILKNDNGISNTDSVTNDGTITVVNPPSSWEYSTDGGTEWTDGTGASFALTEGTYDKNSVQVRDASSASGTKALGGSGQVIIDSTAPAHTININNGVISVANLGDATWKYSVDAGLTWTDGQGSSVLLPPAGSDYAVGSIKVRATDKAGNMAEVINTVAAETPVINLSLNADTGISDIDGKTNDGTINVVIAANTAWEYTTNSTDWVDGSGTSFLLGNNTYITSNIKVRVKGDTATETTLQYSASTIEVSTTPPLALSFALSADSGNVSDNITNVATISVDTTNLVSNAVWQYSMDSGINWTNGTNTSFDLATNTTYGVGSVQVRQVTEDGNISTIFENDKTIIIDNRTPSITNLTNDTITINENTTVVTTLIASEEGAFDTAISGTDADKFSLKADGTLTLNNPANFEDTNNTDHSYSIDVSFIDIAGNTTTNTITVNIADVNEAPVVDTAIADTTGVINQELILDIAANFKDVDADDRLTYSLVSGPALAQISAAGNITFTPDTAGKYSFTVKATDRAGLSSQTDTFSVTVIKLPVITSANADKALVKGGDTVNITVTMSEAITIDTANGANIPSITFDVAGTDVVASYVASGSTTTKLIFAISAASPIPTIGDGTVSVKSIELNGATAVAVSDAGKEWLTSVVGQIVTDLTVDNTAPTITNKIISIDEGTTTVADLASSEDVTFTTTLTGADASAFELTTAGVLTLKQDGDYESKSSYAITVNITDTVGNPNAEDITIAINDINEKPVATTIPTQSADKGQSFNFDASSYFTDEDTNDAFTYKLIDSPSWLSIGKNTGLISVTAPDTTSSNSKVTIRATDKAGLFADSIFNINVVDKVALNITNNQNKDTINSTDGDVIFTFTFSEAVTGFDATDISVNNGTKGSFTGSGTTYSLTVTPATNPATGSITIDVAADAANSVATATLTTSAATSIQNYDFEPPATPTIDLAAASDSGDSDSDKVTNITTPTITGTAEAGATVKIYNGAIEVGSATADASGNYIITVTALNEGTHKLTAIATDTAGNTSAASSALDITVDTTGPTFTSPATTTVALGDTATIYTATATDTNGATYSISGTDANLFNIDPATGELSYKVATTTATTNNVIITAIDTAGNSTDQALAITVADKIVLTITDNATTATNSDVTFTFTFAEIVTGFDISDITVTGGTKGTLTGSGTTYSLTVTPTPNSEGSITVSVDADAATNTVGIGSASSTASQAYDTTAPATPTIDLAATSDTGSDNTDNITSNTKPTITGTTEAGATVKIYNGTTEVGTGIANASGNYSIILTSALSEGVNNLTVKATDSAGNTGSPSNILIVNVDTTNPTVVSTTIATMAINTTAVNNATDFATDTNTLTYSISTTDATIFNIDPATGALTYKTAPTTTATNRVTVIATDTAGNSTNQALIINVVDKVALNITNNQNKDTINSTDGDVTFTFTFSEAVTGFDATDISVNNGTKGSFTGSGTTYSLTVTPATNPATGSITIDVAADAANSVATTTLTTSAATSIQNYDFEPPATPTIDLAAASDSGDSDSDKVTNITTPTITGTAEAGATVKIYNGAIEVGSATADASGNYIITVTALNEGTHKLTAIATDTAGNTSAASSALDITVDTTGPTFTSPATTTVALGDTATIYTATATDTNGATYSISGTDANLFNIDPATGELSYKVATTTATTNNVIITAIDTAGNSTDQALAITVADKIVLTITDNATTATNSDVTFTFTFAEIVTGFDISDITVTGGTKGTLTGSGTTYSLTVTPTPNSEGSITVSVDADAATNTVGIGSASSTASQAYDTTAPATPTIDLAATSDTGSDNTDNITSNTKPTITGTTEAGATVKIYNGTTEVGTGIANASGNYSIILTSALSEGVNNLTVKATDSAGNTGSPSNILIVNVDTTNPTVVSTTIATMAINTTAVNNATDFATDTNTLTYSISTTDATIFNIDPATGALTYKTAPTTTATNRVTVIATDTAGNSTNQALIINVVDKVALNITNNQNKDTINSTDGDVIFTFTFSEAVTGFDATDISVNNGTKGSFTGSGTTYSLTVTPATNPATGSITIDVAADAANSVATTTLTTSAATSIQNYDFEPPATPTIDLAAASDSGDSDSDKVTNITTPTITGTTEAGAAVKIYNGAIEVGTGIANASGDYNITLTSALNEGVNNLSAKATDTAGNTSAASSALDIIIDTMTPSSLPTIDLAAASDTGSDNTDNITSNTKPTITGTAEAGATVKIYNGATEVGTGIANASGNYNITLTSALSEGANNLSAKATDTAGNTSTVSSELNITIDTTAPSTPTIVLATASDTGSSNTDNITSNTKPTITGTAEAGATVKIYNGATEVGTGIANASGNYSIILTSALSEGVNNLTVKATDSAGNTSVASSALDITLDTTAPDTDRLEGLYIDTNNDLLITQDQLYITKNATVNIKISSKSGNLARLYNMDTGEIVQDYVPSGNTLTLSNVQITNRNGDNIFKVLFVDVAGNESTTNVLEFNIRGDTTAPSIPTIVLATASDTGSSNTDNITSNTKPTITGTAEAGATVKIYNGATEVGTGIANASGNYNITLTSALSEGANNLSAKATDTAGNTSTVSSELNITIDTTAPSTPTIVLATASDTGSSNTDNITSNTKPTITGTAEAGATVKIYNGATEVGTGIANASGNYSIILTSALSEGVNNLTVKATDSAGNTSVASSALDITLDTTAPDTDRLEGLYIDTNNDLLITQDQLYITKNATVNIKISSKSGNLARLYNMDTGEIVQDYVPSGNTLTLSNVQITNRNGDNIFKVLFVDVAGNESTTNVLEFNIRGDTTAPSIPTIVLATASDTGSSNTDNITSNTKPTITGTAEAGATVKIYNGATEVGTGIANASGNYNITLTSALSEGANNLSAKATDTAGNTSTVSSELNITIDTTAPSTPTIVLATASDTGSSNTDNITSNTKPTITGTAEAGATVKIYNGAIEVGSATADASGNYIITVTALNEGTHKLTAIATDTAGNTSAASSELNITIDTTAPAVVSITPTTIIFDEAVNINTFTQDFGLATSKLTLANGKTFGTGATIAADIDTAAHSIVITNIDTDVNGTYTKLSATAVAGLTITGDFDPIPDNINNNIDTSKAVYSYTNNNGETWYLWARNTSGYHISKLGSTAKWFWEGADSVDDLKQNPWEVSSWMKSTAAAYDPDSTEVTAASVDAYTDKFSITAGTGSTVAAGDTLNIAANAIVDKAGNNTITATSANYLVQTPLLSTWKTSADNEKVTIRVNNDYKYNYTIDWGDGSVESSQTANATHVYATAGDHQIAITGNYPAISFSGASNTEPNTQLISIDSWGNTAWQSFNRAFTYAVNLVSMPTDIHNLSSVTDMSWMFSSASKFNTDLSAWDTSKVTNMLGMFYKSSKFNKDISAWDTGKVTNMSYMFNAAIVFDQDIGSWNISQVISMSHMFSSASKFNTDLSAWDISKVTNMSGIFNGSAMSITNMDKTLTGWADINTADGETSLQNGVSIGGATITYSNATAMQYLTDTYKWTTTATLKANDASFTVGDNTATDTTATDKSATTTAQTIHGLGGNDTIIGGSAADDIYGGAGNDTLTGGAGADIFHFLYKNTGTDTITDFVSGTDKLDIAVLLDGYDADKSFSDFVTLSTGKVVIDIDGNSSTTSDSITINLTNSNAVEADFVL